LALSGEIVMPTYDYECQACGSKVEVLQSFKDAPLTECPQCGKNELKRLLGTGGGFIFKGSGFYITDYRSEDYKKREKADSEAKAPSGGAKTDAASPSPSPSEKPATTGDASKPSDSGPSKAAAS
jgi:putative FmdB family regulatory protein